MMGLLAFAVIDTVPVIPIILQMVHAVVVVRAWQYQRRGILAWAVLFVGASCSAWLVSRVYVPAPLHSLTPQHRLSKRDDPRWERFWELQIPLNLLGIGWWYFYTREAKRRERRRRRRLRRRRRAANERQASDNRRDDSRARASPR